MNEVASIGIRGRSSNSTLIDVDARPEIGPLSSLLLGGLVVILSAIVILPVHAQDGSESASASSAQPDQGAAAQDDFLDDLFGDDDIADDGNEQNGGSAPAESSEPAEAEASSAESGAQPDDSDDAATQGVIPLAEEEVPRAPPREPPSRQLEEIIVTATKREESVRDIPASIGVVTGDVLEESGARELADYITRIPGVAVQDQDVGLAKISVRGITNETAGNRTTGVLFGDVPVVTPVGAGLVDVDPFDLKSVEILKGPQGTLFGGQSLNGAVRMVPNKPDVGELHMRGFANYVTINEGGSDYAVGLVGNFPIGDDAAIRIVGVRDGRPGVIDDQQRDIEDHDSAVKKSLRIMGRWTPDDRLDLSGYYTTQNTLIQGFPLLTDNDRGRLSRNDQPGPSSYDLNNDMAHIDGRYQFDWGQLVAQSTRIWTFNHNDTDANAAGRGQVPPNEPPGQTFPLVENLRIDARATGRAWIHELRFVSPINDSPWTWVGGLFYQNWEAFLFADIIAANTESTAPLTALPLNPHGIFGPNGINAISASFPLLVMYEHAAFGEVSRQLGENWDLTLGTRYYRTGVNADVLFAGAGGTALTTEPSNPDQSSNIDENGNNLYREQRDNGLTYKFALKWQFKDNITFYTTASKGFQFGGFNLIPSLNPTERVPPVFGSSTLYNYELGVRTEWFNNTLQADLTAFYVDWIDAQVSVLTATTPQTAYVDTVGDVVSQGFEGQILYLTPIPGLSFSFSGSYIESNTAEEYVTSGGAVVPAGQRMPAAPEVQTSAVLAYGREVFGWKTDFNLVHTYQEEAFSDIFHNHTIFDYQAMNASLKVSRPDWRFAPAITLGVNNITDVRARTNVVFAAATPPLPQEDFGKQAASYNKPRAFNLRFSAEF